MKMALRLLLILALIVQSLTLRPAACASGAAPESSVRHTEVAAHSCCCGDGCAMVRTEPTTDSTPSVCGCGDESTPLNSAPVAPLSGHELSTNPGLLSQAMALPAMLACGTVGPPATAAAYPHNSRALHVIHCVWMI